MGKFDEQIAKSRAMLAEAEQEYQDALIKMANAAPHVRQHVLDTYQGKINEATEMIEIFTRNND